MVSDALPLVHMDQLRIGTFVSLDLAWLDHPFLVNSFLIKTEKQLVTLRELGLQMVAFDPLRSQHQPLPLAPEPQAPTLPVINPENQRLIDEKHQRIGRMAAHRDLILSLEKQYETSIGSTKDVLTGILRDPQQALGLADAMSEQLTATFLDDQGATVMMVAAQKLDDITHQHALNVMILTMVICKGLGVSREIMNAAGVGALLHDIGKTSISKTVLRKWPRNRAEETLYRLHCEYGVKLIGEHVNPGVRAVIRQHHEWADGTGFPEGLKGPQINPLARIVAIADRYDTLCNPLRLADALPPAEALSTMFAHEAKRFDTAMLSVFIRELGVYPPGSFVQLSNGSIALVIAASAGSTLKPTVLVYEPGVPRREAVVIHLAESPEVRIECVLRPAALTQDVIDYLNPRMRLSYYAQKASV